MASIAGSGALLGTGVAVLVQLSPDLTLFTGQTRSALQSQPPLAPPSGTASPLAARPVSDRPEAVAVAEPESEWVSQQNAYVAALQAEIAELLAEADQIDQRLDRLRDEGNLIPAPGLLAGGRPSPGEAEPPGSEEMADPGGMPVLALQAMGPSPEETGIALPAMLAYPTQAETVWVAALPQGLAMVAVPDTIGALASGEEHGSAGNVPDHLEAVPVPEAQAHAEADLPHQLVQESTQAAAPPDEAPTEPPPPEEQPTPPEIQQPAVAEPANPAARAAGREVTATENAGGAVAAALPAPLSTADKAALLQQAEQKLALGDVAAARSLYQQAALGGSSRAAAALSRTYQQDFLQGLGESGMPHDPLLAMVWARRAELLAAAEPPDAPAAPPPASASTSLSLVVPAPPPPATTARLPPPQALAPPQPSQPAAVDPAPASRPIPPAAPPPRPEAAQPTAPGGPDRLAPVLRRADEMLALHDISAARRLYTYAAEAGSGRAAVALGQTYDPAFLDRIGARGMRPDPELAARWYRRAAELGEAQAASALSRLEGR
ncbi:hypothetical protein ACFOD4_13335 [Pseudoroseomonas globiformis]|uniref:Sel1 repeat family protein n=1 Tax=Teichococcus globiformis TaxID=2307229 RepID=A0ABV7G0P3_9PROT